MHNYKYIFANRIHIYHHYGDKFTNIFAIFRDKSNFFNLNNAFD